MSHNDTEAGSGEAAHVGAYLADARASIDREFGAGYAAANPGLVAAFIGACSADKLATALRDQVGGGLGEVAAGLHNVTGGLMTADIGRR